MKSPERRCGGRSALQRAQRQKPSCEGRVHAPVSSAARTATEDRIRKIRSRFFFRIGRSDRPFLSSVRCRCEHALARFIKILRLCLNFSHKLCRKEFIVRGDVLNTSWSRWPVLVRVRTSIANRRPIARTVAAPKVPIIYNGH